MNSQTTTTTTKIDGFQLRNLPNLSNFTNLQRLPFVERKNEVTESKRILFNKHVDDQNQKTTTNSGNNNNHRFYTRSHKLDFRKDQSDDAISSNYPNSSYSTYRDLTCSSIASNSAVLDDDLLDQGHDYFFPSDYENITDSERIQQLASLWPPTMKRGRDFLSQQKEIEREVTIAPMVAQSPFNSMLFRANNRFDLSQLPEQQPPSVQYQQEQYRYRDVSPYNQNYTASLNRPRKNLFAANFDDRNSSSSSTTLQSNLSGYTHEHLLRAKRFGAVVGALRKPGHHVGPVKNPDCLCEHCKRWLLDKEQMRGRALSMGDEPLNRLKSYWSKRVD